MNKKKVLYIINVILIIVITFLTVFTLVKENPKEKLEAMSNLGILGVIAMISIYVVNVLIEGCINKLVIKSTGENISYVDAMGSYCTGALFSNITPMKIGNMPAVIYAYNRSGVKIDLAVASFIQGNLMYLFNMIIICSGCMIACYSLDMSINIGNTSVELATVALVGLIYTIALILFSLLIAFNSFLQNLFLKISSWILLKFKKISSREEYYKEQEKKLELYRLAIKNFLKNFKLSCGTLLLYILKTLIWGSLPYVIYLLLSESTFYINQFFYSFMLSQLLYYVASIVPIPGASGAIEISFMAVYSNMVSEEYMVSLVLLWRTITYFIPIIVGFIFCMNIFNKRKKEDKLLDNTIN